LTDILTSQSSSPLSLSAKKIIVQEANQCVSCGLCLPACPTYRVLKSEADSPRGRIALMNGVATGKIPLNMKFHEHMDRCLTCRACEEICPNDVAYGRLIDQARILVVNKPHSTKKKYLSRFKYLLQRMLLTRPERLDRLRYLFYCAQKMGLLDWVCSFKRWSSNSWIKLLASLPAIKFPYFYHTNDTSEPSKRIHGWQEIYPVEKNRRGEVALFLGCVARLTDVATLNASIHVLNRLGFTVHVPQTQTCCGALYQHSGYVKEVAALNQQNKIAFTQTNIEAIITTASGCGAQLLEHGLFAKNIPVVDISQFLTNLPLSDWEPIKILPVSGKVIVHDPCTLRNVLHAQSYPYVLLSRIPDTQVTALSGNDQCCGAAGTYFLDESEIANALLTDKLNDVLTRDAKYLVTSNIGCSMHMVQGLREKGISIEVLHPVTLIARQMME